MKPLKAISILSVVTIITPLMGIILTPIVLQFYSKADFGGLAFFTSLATILAGLSTGRLELLIPGKKTKFGKIRNNILATKLSLLTNFYFVAPSLFLTALLFDISLAWLIYLLIAIVVLALYNILTIFHLASQDVENIAKAKIALSLTEPSSQLLIALLIKATAVNLIFSFILGHLTAVRLLRPNLL
jgi:hypothetical protein